jgi:hypothetical protein
VNRSFSVAISGLDLVVEEDGTSESHRIDSIQTITAYKNDFTTIDQICVFFEGPDWSFTVTEDALGFRELMCGLIEALEGLDADWFGQVAFPAFEEKRTVIYSRV